MIAQDIRRITTVSGHLFAALRRAFSKIFLSFLGFGVGGAAIVEVVNFVQSKELTSLGHIAAGVFGVVLGYAAGLTAAVVEAIRGLITAARDAEQGAVAAERTVANDAGSVLRGVEDEVKKLEHR